MAFDKLRQSILYGISLTKKEGQFMSREYRIYVKVRASPRMDKIQMGRVRAINYVSMPIYTN